MQQSLRRLGRLCSEIACVSRPAQFAPSPANYFSLQRFECVGGLLFRRLHFTGSPIACLTISINSFHSASLHPRLGIAIGSPPITRSKRFVVVNHREKQPHPREASCVPETR